MNKSDMIEALKCLNSKLATHNVRAEVSIVGGQALCLAYSHRTSTHDIDALFEPKSTVYQLSGEVAEELGLPHDWLNDGVKGFINSSYRDTEFLELSNLSVRVATAEYLLQMKCLSSRVDHDNELDDIRFLLDYLDITTVDQAVELLTQYYPINQFPPKSYYVLQEILDD